MVGRRTDLSAFLNRPLLTFLFHLQVSGPKGTQLTDQAISNIQGLLFFQVRTPHANFSKGGRRGERGVVELTRAVWGGRNACAQLLFTSFSSLFSALFTFPADFAILVKERQSGMYRLRCGGGGRVGQRHVSKRLVRLQTQSC